MFIAKRKFVQSLFLIMMICTVSMIIGFLFLGLKNNANMIYTTLLTVPFFISSCFVVYKADCMTQNNNVHYSKKHSIILKLVFLRILANILNLIPFFVVCIVLFLTQNNSKSFIDNINLNSYFNLWISISLTIAMYIVNIVIIVIESIKNTKSLKTKNSCI